jgi:hypothetical protein
MDDTTSDTLDQADEDILTPTVSDEALEAAAGTERGERITHQFSGVIEATRCC